MKEKGQRLFITPALGLGLFLVLPWLLTGKAPQVNSAQPEAGIIRVATTGSDTSGCGSQPSPCRTVQYAVDQAQAGDEIRVATGNYTGVQGHATPAGYPNPPASGIITQVVYINKTIVIRGGYTTDFVEPPHPETNPTTLDAQGKGRALVIAGNFNTTIEGLRLTRGTTTGLGGVGYSNRGGGGGMYVISATVTISNNLMFDNRASDGGGVFLEGSFATLTGNTIYSNTIPYYGSGVLQHNGSATMARNKIHDNTATSTLGSGGGVYVYTGAATLSENTIYSNTVQSNGGGIFLNTSKNALLTGNNVLSNTAQSGWGGGLWMRYGDGTHMNENTFTANNANSRGGGLYIDQSYSTLVGNTILSNTAESGGGLYLSGREITLTANTILSNTAFMGGGAYLEYNDSTLNRNTISFNRVTFNNGEGGGILIYYSEPSLNGNIISFNYADWGGGLGVFHSSPVLSNTVIADNIAGKAGGGIHIRNSSSPRLWHSTIVRNRGGDGSGVTIGYMFPDDCNVTMTNTMVVSHSVGISITEGDTVTLAGTLWYNNTTDWDGAGTIITGTHNYWGNPLFAADGYHILESSAAIDHGIFTGVTTDLDNQTRLGIPDLGADELAVDYRYMYLPLIGRGY